MYLISKQAWSLKNVFEPKKLQTWIWKYTNIGQKEPIFLLSLRMLTSKNEGFFLLKNIIWSYDFCHKEHCISIGIQENVDKRQINWKVQSYSLALLARTKLG